MTQVMTPDDGLREQAVVRLRKKHEFWSHVIAYVLVNAMFVTIWVLAGADGFFWPVILLLGWGIGLFFHGYDVYVGPPTEEQITREMERLGRR